MTTETNAERLERIMLYVKYVGNEKKMIGVTENDLLWLIQQAERVQELDVSNNRCVKIAMNRQKHIDHLENEKTELKHEINVLKNSIGLSNYKASEEGAGSQLSKRERGLYW